MRLRQARAVLIAASLIVVSLALPARAQAGCVPPAETTYVGIALAYVGANGQWTGRWLGAHPLACDGDTYVLAVAAPSWSDLETILAVTGPERFLIGDLPYAGDGTCLPGAIRLWWTPTDATADGATMHWQMATVPPTAPAFPCPTNAPADGALVLLRMNPLP